jgi:hypothetical protein
MYNKTNETNIQRYHVTGHGRHRQDATQAERRLRRRMLGLWAAPAGP